MLEFKSRELKLKFNDKEYTVKYPTVNDVVDFTEELEKKEVKEVTVIMTLLDKLGLPKKVSGLMEIGQLNALVTELLKEKK